MQQSAVPRTIYGLIAALTLTQLTASPILAQDSGPQLVVLPTDRTVLPIPEPQYPHSTVFDARNAKPPPRFEVKAPVHAPNVLIVLIDDMGFGQSSAFGGPVHMPTVERLANNGLRYNEFHTTALCCRFRSRSTRTARYSMRAMRRPRPGLKSRRRPPRPTFSSC